MPKFTGLRVAKEDKHTNLIRGRAMKAEAQSQAVLKVRFHFPLTLVFFIFSQLQPAIAQRETVPCDAALQRPFLAKVAPPASPRGHTTRPQGLKEPRLPRPSNTISSKRIKKSLSINVPDFAGMLPGGVSSDSGIGASSSGTDTDWESTCPKFTITADLSDDLPEKSNTISDFLQSSPDTFGSEYFSPPMETSTFLDMETTVTCGTNLDMLMTMEEHRLLTQDERTELYNLIDNSMPQVHGIDESSGTYNFYMNGRSHSYFDPLLLVNHQVKPAKLGVQGNKMTKSTYDSEPSMDYVDVRKWLSEEIDLTDIGLDTHERHAFRNEFDPNFGFSDILSSLDAGSYGAINGSAAHLPMHVPNQYSVKKSIDIDPINGEVRYSPLSGSFCLFRLVLCKKPNKKLKHDEENVEPNDAQRHVLSSLTSAYGRVRTTSARGGI